MCLGGGDGDIHCSNMRILYVEDHADTRDLVSYVLTGANYEVALAENREQATLLAQTASLDLYLIIVRILQGVGKVHILKSVVSFISEG
jgi:DNA-binding response OmpR family regulator